MRVVRHLVVLVTGFLAGSRTVAAIQGWNEWHGLRGDTAAIAAAREQFLVDLTVACLSLAIAGLVWWLLRPKSS